MFSRNPVLAWIGIMVFTGVFLTLLMGQDCAAQGGVCDPDPCQWIQNAVPDTCTAIAGVCGPANDFTCECVTPFTWEDTTNTCETLCVDNDEDDSYAIDSVDCPQGDDCDDNNADVYPGAPELCDSIDNQCPGDTGYGEADEGCVTTVTGVAWKDGFAFFEQGIEISLTCSGGVNFLSAIEEGGNFSIQVPSIETLCGFNDVTYNDGWGGTHIYSCDYSYYNCSFPITATDTEINLGMVNFNFVCVDTGGECFIYCMTRCGATGEDPGICMDVCTTYQCN